MGSSYVKELRHIPDFLDLTLEQAFNRFDAANETARQEIVAKVEESRQGNTATSAYERERQEANAVEEKKREAKEEKEKRIDEFRKLAEKEGRVMTEDEKNGIVAEVADDFTNPLFRFSWAGK